MVNSCIVPGCTPRTRRGHAVSFHILPVRDLQRYKLWLRAINHPKLPEDTSIDKLKNLRVCSRHFKDEDFESDVLGFWPKALKDTAVPSLFTFPGEHEPPQGPATKRARLQTPTSAAALVSPEDKEKQSQPTSSSVVIIPVQKKFVKGGKKKVSSKYFRGKCSRCHREKRRRALQPFLFNRFAYVQIPLGNVISNPAGEVIPNPFGEVIPHPVGEVIPHPVGEVIPHPFGEVIPNPAIKVIPHPAGEVIPHPFGEVIPHPVGEVIPHHVGEVIPHVGEVIPNPAIKVIPHPVGEVIPHPAGEVIPHPAGEVIPNPAIKVIPHPVGEVIPNPAIKVIPHPVGEVIPNPAIKVIPHPVGEVIPHPVGEVIPHPVGEVIPHPVGEVIPHPVGEVIPHPAGEVIPHPVGEVIPHPAGEVIPHPAGEVIPHPAGEVIPHPAGEVTPVAAGSTQDADKKPEKTRPPYADHDYLHFPPSVEEQLQAARWEIAKLTQEKDSLMASRFCLQRFQDDAKLLTFYTGFQDYDTLKSVYLCLEPTAERLQRWSQEQSVQETSTAAALKAENLTLIDQFFLFLCRVTEGASEESLAERFHVSPSTVSRVVTTWANYLFFTLGSLPLWLRRSAVKQRMPRCFKDTYPRTRVILDCVEVRIKRASSKKVNPEKYSAYEGSSTLKGLIGVSPSGEITFVSSLHEGSNSAKEITKRSGILSLLEEGDEVMADKSFLISDLLSAIRVSLVSPPFLNQRRKFTKDEASVTQNNAKLRIHVERAKQRMKQYHIFDGVLPCSLLGVVNQLWYVRAMLANFQGPLS